LIDGLESDLRQPIQEQPRNLFAVRDLVADGCGDGAGVFALNDLLCLERVCCIRESTKLREQMADTSGLR